MSDLISRQAAIDICANAIDLWRGQLGEGALVAVRDKIAALPPAQPKKGKWVEHKSTGYLMCDQCKDVYINPEWLADGRWNFCPNCGSYNGGRKETT